MVIMSDRAIQVRAVLSRVTSEPFRYGKMDCCQLLNEISIAISGVDHSVKFPIYNEDSYEDVLEANGGVEGIAELCLGGAVDTEELQVGDCALVEHESKALLGVFDGSDGVFIKTDGGVIRVGMSHVTKGWHI